jgi:hypothetical protein
MGHGRLLHPMSRSVIGTIRRSSIRKMTDDGSVIMKLQVGSLWEVKRWLIGWAQRPTFLNHRNCIETFKQSAGQC